MENGLRIPSFKGIIPAMITPFAEDESIDEEATRRIIEHLIGSGVHGIMCCGSTGEGAALSREEHREFARLVVECVRHRVPIIAGTGNSGTKSTVNLTKDAAEVGVDAALIVTPYYIIPTLEGISEHYRRIVNEVDLPILLYNVPQATSVNLTPQLISRIVNDSERIVGLKESSGSISQIAETLHLVGDEISILTGNDAGLYTDFLLGCPGAIVAIGNVAPNLAVEIYDRLRAGELQKAKQTYYRLLPVALALDGEPNWAARVKEMVKLLGLPGGYARRPCVPLKNDEVEPLKAVLRAARLLQ
jgi:4-hydroxy-tetrahydrodipicolinate synthase